MAHSSRCGAKKLPDSHSGPSPPHSVASSSFLRTLPHSSVSLLTPWHPSTSFRILPHSALPQFSCFLLTSPYFSSSLPIPLYSSHNADSPHPRPSHRLLAPAYAPTKKAALHPENSPSCLRCGSIFLPNLQHFSGLSIHFYTNTL